MTQLTGTLGKGSSAMCQIKEDCVELMTSQGLTGYGITHQILWSMLSEQVGDAQMMTGYRIRHQILWSLVSNQIGKTGLCRSCE